MKKIVKASPATEIQALRRLLILVAGLVGIVIAYVLPVIVVCVLGTGIVVIFLAMFTDLVISGCDHRVARCVTKEK